MTEIPHATCGSHPEEAAEYLERSLRRALSRPGIELLERRTEGWIAGLQLASLSLRDAEDPERLLADLSGLEAGFVDYLADEILSRQPAAVVSFLLHTAILDRFCVPRCAKP